MTADLQHAHALLDRVPAGEIGAAVRFLEFLLLDPLSRALATAPIEDEAIGDEERQAVARSQEWFKHNEGIAFEQVVAELGLTMDQVRHHRLPDEDEEREPAA
jgi:hypothetical protein